MLRCSLDNSIITVVHVIIINLSMSLAPPYAVVVAVVLVLLRNHILPLVVIRGSIV